jgi:hypothetical protein
MGTLPRAVSALVSYRASNMQEQPATRYGNVLVRDERHHSHAGPRRYFWLLDEGIQLIYEPYAWTNEWYVDVVWIRSTERDRLSSYEIIDAYVDVVVEGMGPTYRILDLDQFGEALLTGQVEPADAADVLRRAQRFVDRYLHRNAPFPPPQIRPLFAADHQYRSWR